MVLLIAGSSGVRSVTGKVNGQSMV